MHTRCCQKRRLVDRRPIWSRYAPNRDRNCAGDPGQRNVSRETDPPPQNLIWTDVAPPDRQQIIEQLAAQSRANYEKITTWQGSYFFKSDPANFFWTRLELYVRAFRGELGAELKNAVEQRLRISKADGPGGRWFRDQMGFTNPGGPTLWITTFWSPQSGYLPVSMVRSFETPDGKPESKIEWQWKLIDGVYLPSTIKESAYRAAGGKLSRDQTTRLKECALNRPLGPHQFDERGLGLIRR